MNKTRVSEKRLLSITEFLSEQIPAGFECTGCPYLDIDFCHLMEEQVDKKECGINEEGAFDISLGDLM